MFKFPDCKSIPVNCKKREFMSGKFALAAGGSRGIGKSAEIKSAEQG